MKRSGRTVRASPVVVAASCLAGAACTSPVPPAPLAPRTSGTIAVAGLSAPVRIARDDWGVPHIYAGSAHDLFVAQGFVQAEDRLFQMDLWKRSSEGRLSQVLGPNFIERDAMTRRFQYRGDLRSEWSSYADDAEEIAGAFVAGVNAWVELARARPPEEFVAAGWRPEFWTATDLLSRTDAFLASSDALAEVQRSGVNDVVAEAIRRVGTAPFLVALGGGVAKGSGPAAPADERLRGQRPAAPCRATVAGGRLAFDDVAPRFDLPSRGYLVHLHAPGWNAIGVARPWLPGVVAGHNEQIAWAPVPVAADTQDVYRDPSSSARPIGRVPVVVKGRRTPFVFDLESTPHGLVVASDRANGVAFTLRWSGTEPGGAAWLASLAIDRATSWERFRDAAARWKMPTARLLFADAGGTTGFQDVGLVPRRRAGEWVGWVTPDSLPHERSDAASWSAVDSTRTLVERVPDGPREVIFSSILGVTAAARRRFDAGPYAAPATDDNPVRLEITPRRWDDSRAINAPGQSESPASAHRSDGAQAWSTGRWMPLPFSDEAVRAATRETLTLVPKRPST